MSEIKKISKVLDYFSNNYKDQYAIATSLLMYVDTSNKKAIEKEMVKRINIFKMESETIDNECTKIFEILDDLKENLGLKYSDNEEILYCEDKFKLNYKFLSDFCKGASMINSIYSKEYLDMSNKWYKIKLSQLLTKINNNLVEDIIEKKNRNLDGIVNSEIDYIVKMNSHETNNGVKLLNYHGTVNKDRDLYISKIKLKDERAKEEQEIKEKELKIANEKNEIIGKAIGIFMLHKHTIYKITSDEYNYLANSIKEMFKTDYNGNIEENNIKIVDVAVNICKKYNAKYPSQEKPWGEETDGSDSITYKEETIIKEVAEFRINLDKDLQKEYLINKMREINSYFVYKLDSVKVKKIVEELFDDKQKKEQENIKTQVKVDETNKEKIDGNILSKLANIFKIKNNK